MQAFTGLMSTTGNEGESPVRLGVSLVDMGTGMWSAMGVLAAILERTRSGEGCMVEASLLDTGMTWMSIVIAGYLATKRVPKKLGSAIAMTAPYELFRCADAHIFIAAGNNGLFSRVCKALGRPELMADPRFADNSGRVNHRAELHAAIEATTVGWQAAELVRVLRKHGAPCSELNNVAQALDESQVKAVDILYDLPTAAVPELRVVALPIKAKGRRSDRKSPPPTLGADTEAVLSAIGYDERRIAKLRASGAIA
jgi:crotonobetainyl-CoA:carnitine CoA-transferase CaiB-like acyl-CoA transferase